MKNFFLLMLGAFLISMSSFAQELIPLTVSLDDDYTPISHGHPKTPITAPKVYIDDYTLLFEANHPEYVLNIKDEDDNVVYTTTVYSSQTQVILPSTLSGDYQI